MERQNRSLLKTLKIEEVEGNKWTDELPKYLMAYRSTPQESTGATPAFLVFGKEIKSKFPELRPEQSVVNEDIRDRDWSNKLTQKAYADDKRGAVPSPIIPGDQVLLKNTKSTGKLLPNFEPEPYTVLAKEGSQITVQSSKGTIYNKDSSFCKPYISPAESKVPGEYSNVKDTDTSDQKSIEIETSRPRRIIKAPERFKDYVVGKP